MVMGNDRIEAVQQFLQQGRVDDAVKSIVASIAEFGDQPLMNAMLLDAIAILQGRVAVLEQRLEKIETP